MRGADTYTEHLFTVRKLEEFIPAHHPLRPIRVMVNQALAQMNGLFSKMYEADIKGGRSSIAPEKLLRAMLLQVLFSVRSERMLMEQIEFNLLFRWFVGLSMDDAVWVPTVFTKNRKRLIDHDAVVEFFNQIVEQADQRDLLSKEHFSVDGTLIQAWAGHKSFVNKARLGPDGKLAKQDDDDSNPGGAAGSGADFHGEKRSNDTHQSTTDADARLYRKGKTASELRFMGHTLMDNRHGLIVNALVTQADGYAEREAAKAMIADACQCHPDYEGRDRSIDRSVEDDGQSRVETELATITLGADKGYDAQEFIEALDELGVESHVAQNKSGRRSAVSDRVAATPGYAMSLQKRKRIEQGFGWAKTVGQMRQVMVRGIKKVDQMFVLTMAAFNLTRLRTLMGEMRPELAQCGR